MHKNRIEAFSDGVIAILITIMVLELKVPHGANFYVLLKLGPTFLSYVLSFVYLAIYWNNHHHLFQTVRSVAGAVLWSNMHLLFWLSLLPFTTAWVGEGGLSFAPIAAYGIVLTMCAVAYFILARTLVAQDGPDSTVGRAIGQDAKGKWSIGLYVVAIVIAAVWPWMAALIYVGVALLWLVPDRRVERTLIREGALKD